MLLTILTLAQIIGSVSLIILIVMQAKGTGLSAAFGGGGMFYRSKRGVEKILYRGTIGVALIVGICSILLVVIGKTA